MSFEKWRPFVSTSMCQNESRMRNMCCAIYGPLKYSIIALWWWFCTCCFGGAMWFHTSWLFLPMYLPTESLFYSYFLSGNTYGKPLPVKNIGQFQFCVHVLPLALIWRSAQCTSIENKYNFEILYSEYLLENNGIAGHHGHPADCQLALTNVVEVQTKVVTMD